MHPASRLVAIIEPAMELRSEVTYSIVPVSLPVQSCTVVSWQDKFTMLV